MEGVDVPNKLGILVNSGAKTCEYLSTTSNSVAVRVDIQDAVSRADMASF
jgi:hypothetical protein